MPETFQKAPPEIKQSKPRVENQGNSEKIENNFRAVQKIAEKGKDTKPIRGFKVTAEQTATKIVDAKDETRAKTLARAEGRDSPENPATDIDNKVQEQGKEVKEPQKDTVPVTAENKQATQSTEQQTEQTKQTAEIPQQEFSESRLSEAESVGPGDNQERLEKVVESLKSQVKSLEDALQQGSEVRENIRKGIFGPKVLFMLRLINILANNSVITKLLSLDSKVADIKDLWGEYQDMKDKTRSRRKSSDSFQGAAAAASGANFENSNLNFLKEISEEFLKSVIAGLKSEGGGEGLNIDQIRADIIDELDSLVDVGKEVDVRKLSASNPRIIESIKNSVQNFARGKGTKQSLGLNIMAGIKS